MRGQGDAAERILYGQMARMHPTTVRHASALAEAAIDLLEAVSAGEITFIKNAGFKCSEASGLVAALFTPYCLHMPNAPAETSTRTQFHIGIEWDPSEHDPQFILCRMRFSANGETFDPGGDDCSLLQRDRNIEKILAGANQYLQEIQDPDLGEHRSVPLAGAKARHLAQPYLLYPADLLLAIEKLQQT